MSQRISDARSSLSVTLQEQRECVLDKFLKQPLPFMLLGASPCTIHQAIVYHKASFILDLVKWYQGDEDGLHNRPNTEHHQLHTGEDRLWVAAEVALVLVQVQVEFLELAVFLLSPTEVVVALYQEQEQEQEVVAVAVQQDATGVTVIVETNLQVANMQLSLRNNCIKNQLPLNSRN